MHNGFAAFLAAVLWALPAMAAPEGGGKVTFSATFQFTAAADGKVVRITDGVVTDGAIGPDQLM